MLAQVVLPLLAIKVVATGWVPLNSLTLTLEAVLAQVVLPLLAIEVVATGWVPFNPNPGSCAGAGGAAAAGD